MEKKQNCVTWIQTGSEGKKGKSIRKCVIKRKLKF